MLQQIEATTAGIGSVALCCCICGGSLSSESGRLRCRTENCPGDFPVVNGIPVLINEANSIFRLETFLQGDSTFFKPRPAWKERLGSVLPEISSNPDAAQRYREFADLLLARSARPVVLVIGGGIAGRGAREFLENPAIEFVETDVSFGDRTRFICDAHD